MRIWYNRNLCQKILLWGIIRFKVRMMVGQERATMVKTMRNMHS